MHVVYLPCLPASWNALLHHQTPCWTVAPHTQTIRMPAHIYLQSAVQPAVPEQFLSEVAASPGVVIPEPTQAVQLAASAERQVPRGQGDTRPGVIWKYPAATAARRTAAQQDKRSSQMCELGAFLLCAWCPGVPNICDSNNKTEHAGHVHESCSEGEGQECVCVLHA